MKSKKKMWKMPKYKSKSKNPIFHYSGDIKDEQRINSYVPIKEGEKK